MPTYLLEVFSSLLQTGRVARVSGHTKANKSSPRTLLICLHQKARPCWDAGSWKSWGSWKTTKEWAKVQSGRFSLTPMIEEGLRCPWAEVIQGSKTAAPSDSPLKYLTHHGLTEELWQGTQKPFSKALCLCCPWVKGFFKKWWVLSRSSYPARRAEAMWLWIGRKDE